MDYDIKILVMLFGSNSFVDWIVFEEVIFGKDIFVIVLVGNNGCDID